MSNELSCMILRKEAGSYVSYCPQLGLYSQGETRERALAALGDTIAGWVLVVGEHGTFDAALAERLKEAKDGTDEVVGS